LFGTITEVAQRTIEAGQTAQIIIIIYFTLILIAGILFVLANYTLKNAPTLDRTFFIPWKRTKKRGKKIISGILEDEKRRPISLMKVTLSNALEHKIDSTFSNQEGRFCFKVNPGSYLVTAEKFGFEPAVTKIITLKEEDKKIEVALKTKKIEDAKANPPSVKFLIFSRPIFLVLAAAGVYTTYLALSFFSIIIALTALATVITSLAFFILNRRIGLELCDHKGKKIKNIKVEIASAKGEVLEKAETDNAGKINLFVAEGFYKIISDQAPSRTFKANSREIVSLKLKI